MTIDISILNWSGNMKKNKGNTLKYLSLITQVGLSSITPLLMGVYIGNLIDKKIGKQGVFSIILLILGAMTGIYNIYKLAGPKKKE